jgi:hypothetical protein
MKYPLTPTGIERATFRIVAQHLNHCATAVPHFCTVSDNSFDTTVSCVLWKLLSGFVEVLSVKRHFIFTVISSEERFVLQCDSSYGRHQPYNYKIAVLREVTPCTWKDFTKASQKTSEINFFLSEEFHFFSEDRKSVYFYQTARCFNPKDCIKISNRLENFEFQTIYK